MSSDDEGSSTAVPPPPTVICKLALAPSEDPKDAVTNTELCFHIAVGPGTYGFVANGTRVFVEESASTHFLPYIANRVLDESSPTTLALEFVYGNGKQIGLGCKSMLCWTFSMCI